MKSKTMMGGSSEEHNRHEADFYPTPRECTVALLDVLGRELEDLTLIWEPACGDGAISEVVSERGVSVISTDLHDRGHGIANVDFLKTPNVFGAKAIITNPPFNIAADFIRHASTMHIPFAMLLKATYWNAASRHQLFTETGPKAVCPLTWRPAFAPTRGKSPTMEFCWTIWGPTPSDVCDFVPLRRPQK